VLSGAYQQTWRDAVRYDPAKSAPLTWLLMICRSRALDALRARDPAMVHEDPASLVPEADQMGGDDPLDLLAAMASHRALHTALDALTPSQRQMIALAFFRGMSHQEIAEQTYLPLGTVKSQIRRALATLRSALAAE
jgi:RNA polymerase sigma factor (sigma-70 family)